MYTIVVPTYNRARELRTAVETLVAQVATVPFEIVVVDNRSSDDTRAVVEGLSGDSRGVVRYVFEGRQGLSAARNAGIAAARGDVIAFVDDDVLADSCWLQRLVDAYEAHPDAWCIGGRVRLQFPGPHPAWFDETSSLLAAYLSRLDLGEETVRLDVPTIIGANLSVRREAFSVLGPFDTRLGRCGASLYGDEDVEFVARVLHSGRGVYYCGQAVIFHIVPRARMTKRWFRNRAYAEGATAGFRAVQSGRQFAAPRFLHEGSILGKDCIKTLAFCAAGDARRAFLHELAVRKRFGHLERILRPAPVRGPAAGLAGL